MCSVPATGKVFNAIVSKFKRVLCWKTLQSSIQTIVVNAVIGYSPIDCPCSF